MDIAKGTTDLGVARFNQINNLKNPATYSQATQSLSYNTITPDIAYQMVTNTGHRRKKSMSSCCCKRFGLVGMV